MLYSGTLTTCLANIANRMTMPLIVTIYIFMLGSNIVEINTLHGQQHKYPGRLNNVFSRQSVSYGFTGVTQWFYRCYTMVLQVEKEVFQVLHNGFTSATQLFCRTDAMVC